VSAELTIFQRMNGREVCACGIILKALRARFCSIMFVFFNVILPVIQHGKGDKSARIAEDIIYSESSSMSSKHSSNFASSSS